MMDNSLPHRADRFTLLLAAILLGIVGPGCVSWDPIFRGTLGVLRALSNF